MAAYNSSTGDVTTGNDNTILYDGQSPQEEEAKKSYDEYCFNNSLPTKILGSKIRIPEDKNNSIIYDKG